MKGEITLKILERVKDFTVGAIDLIDVFTTAGYGASFRKFEYELSKRQQARAQRNYRREYVKQRREEEIHLRQRFHSMLHNLRRDGLLKQKTKDGQAFLHLTPKGEQYLSLLKERYVGVLPLPRYEKQKSHGHGIVIIAFDIPESERRKRDWLRSALRNLRYQMIQKSVWVGTARIPKEFLEDLDKFRITPFVEIFEVTKTGSLRQVA